MEENKKSSMRDLTEGNPMKLILGFVIPMLFGFLFQQFYNLVDTMIVGKFLGSDALAAVGSTGSINFLVIGFCMGVCNGFVIPVAQQFGAKNYRNLRKYVANGAWLCIAFAVVLTLFTTIFTGQILTIMKTPSDIFQDAYIYIFIIFCGIPATFLYNILSGIIRSLGDSKTPVIFLALSSIINIVLDVVLIYNVKMGVAGAALATVISQAVSGIGCFFVMKKKFGILKMTKEEMLFDSHYAKILCGMGIPMGLQYSITAIGSVILQTAVNTLGTIYVASVTAGSKLSMFFCCPYDAMGSTMATYGGQNVGAGKLDRIGKGLKSCVLLGAIYSVIAFVVLFFFAKDLALLFVDNADVEIIEQTYMFIMANCTFYFPLALVNIIRFLIQGMGFSQFAILAGIFEMVARSITGFLLVPVWGYTAACFGNALAWIFADAFLIPAYFICRNRLRKRLENL
ncbi:MAG: MATE family efflux transporter [Thermoflexaceae bacterium]|nr:MATE family efflux transporter [Thermoflexaceae bacterium]